jgi:hypothetical protein
MSTQFRTDAGGLWTEQDAGSALDYTLDWSDTLDPSDTIGQSVWIGDTGLTVDRTSHDDATSTAWLSGGVGGRWYRVSCQITTGTGRVHVKGFRVLVKGRPETAYGPSVFGDIGQEVATLRRDRLALVAARYAPGHSFSDEYLASKLWNAEKTVERLLRVFLLPREMVPDGTPQEEIDVLTAAGELVEIEPGYDYDPRAFTSSWGAIDTRHRPIIRLHSVTLHYPQEDGPFYAMDMRWIRTDRKYGRVQFVPYGTFMAAQLGTFIANGVGFGAAMPLTIRMRYRAGLENCARDWPDILDAIRSKAVLDLVDGLMLPHQASVSGDGLSQSMSVALDKHREGVEHKLNTLRNAIHGIRLTVV